MIKSDHESNAERKRAPADLMVISSAITKASCEGVPTAVMVSMQRTNGSDVMYLESENAYSFHN